MAIKKSHSEDMMNTTGFDVVCTIGRVEFGKGQDDPEVAAFKLIAEHGTEGEFTFPRGDGRTVHVHVEYSGGTAPVEAY